MAGRKPKLTPELIKEAEKLIRAGNYAITVCNYLGIGESTWYRWMQEGEQATRGIKREFWESIKKAEAIPEIRNVNQIQKAAEENWTAAMAYLERRFPSRWGRKERMEADITHSGKDGGPIQSEVKMDFSKLSDKELEVFENLVEKLSESE